MASRLDKEGLRLFTDGTGNVPADVAPPAPTNYVGFAGDMRVNAAIVADPTLIRNGTGGGTVPVGSNEIIRKVSEFAFGAYAYQQGKGTANISAGTIFTSTGMTQSNKVTGNQDLTDYVPDLDAAPNITAPASFSMTIGATTQLITIAAGDTATNLVSKINTAFGSTVASLNGVGQLSFTAGADITLANGTIGSAGMADLGFTFGTTPAKNPSFTVQVGTQSPVTVSVTSADTAASLLTKLNAVPGLTASLGPGGELIMKPTTGGDIKLQNVTGTPVSALGVTVTNVAHSAFRQSNLGPDGSLSTGLLGSSTLEDFSRNMISSQAEDASLNKDTLAKESSFLTTLDQRNSDISGVDMDQELSEMIRIQTAYTAAARVISASEKLFDELINGFNL